MLEQLCGREREKEGTCMCFDSFTSGAVSKRQGCIPDYLCALASNYRESQQDIILFRLCLPLLVYFSSSFSPGFQLFLFLFFFWEGGLTSSLTVSFGSTLLSPCFHAGDLFSPHFICGRTAKRNPPSLFHKPSGEEQCVVILNPSRWLLS